MTTIKSQIDPMTYEAAHETAVLIDRSSLALFQFSGTMRLDLINRISTQAVDSLKNGQGAATVLTTNIGRIIDRLILYAGDETVYALAGENHHDPLARYLLRNVFFQDDFKLQDVSDNTAVFAVYGPQAGKKLSAAGFPEIDFPRHHWRSAEIAGIQTSIHRTDPIASDGYFIICPADDKAALWQYLVDAGLIPADQAAFDFLRIEAGLPRYGRELTLDYIPLEANLWDDVSFSKGCYTGQEIIARMESRGRLAKKLVRLQIDSPEPPENVELTAVGKGAGTITATAVGPTGLIGLGYVKTAVLDAGSQLMAGETAVIPLINDQE